MYVDFCFYWFNINKIRKSVIFFFWEYNWMINSSELIQFPSQIFLENHSQAVEAFFLFIHCFCRLSNNYSKNEEEITRDDFWSLFFLKMEKAKGDLELVNIKPNILGRYLKNILRVYYVRNSKAVVYAGKKADRNIQVNKEREIGISFYFIFIFLFFYFFLNYRKTINQYMQDCQ
jgi:hypothetical protein